MSGTHKDLEVWRAAMVFAVQVYRLTALFPKEARYGLISQLRRRCFQLGSSWAIPPRKTSTPSSMRSLELGKCLTD